MVSYDLLHLQRETIKFLKYGASLMVLVLAFVAFGAQQASAHYVYSMQDLYWTGNSDCVEGYSEVSHGTGKGYSKAYVDSTRVYIGSEARPCQQDFDRPPGYMANRMQFTGYFAPNWLVCKDTGWIYNAYTQSRHEVRRTWGSWCGVTSYYTNAGLFVLNGNWKGGWMSSGNHYFDH